jgi:hypothetical protein
VLGQPDDESAHQESLVLLVGHVLERDDHVPPEQLAEVRRMTALEEPSGRAAPQGAEPDLDERPDIDQGPSSETQVGGHIEGSALEVAQGGNARRDDGAGSRTTGD